MSKSDTHYTMNLALQIASIAVMAIAIPVLYFTRPQPVPPPPVTAVNLTPSQLPGQETAVVMASALKPQATQPSGGKGMPPMASTSSPSSSATANSGTGTANQQSRANGEYDGLVEKVRAVEAEIKIRLKRFNDQTQTVGMGSPDDFDAILNNIEILIQLMKKIAKINPAKKDACEYVIVSAEGLRNEVSSIPLKSLYGEGGGRPKPAQNIEPYRG